MTSNLEIQEVSGTSCKTLRLADASSYNPDITPENGVLEVTPPGFGCAVSFSVSPGFNFVLNSSTLRIVPAVTSNDLLDLPDGVYVYRYSIKPNDKLFVEYNSLRECQLLHKFYLSVCQLFDERIRITKREFEEKRRNLIWIKELIDSAKYKVEECNEVHEGLQLYNEANRLLDRKNSCFC